MECNQARELISAYADGELDADQRIETERHLVDCLECSRTLESISALKNAMRDDALLYNVPGALRKKIETMVNKAADLPAQGKPKASRPVHRLKYFAIATAAAFALAAGITGIIRMWPSAQRRIETEAVRDHQRSLTANHLIDFPSSDPQTVLRWLSTQLSYSPMAPGRLPTGYTLAGARVDTLDGRKVAVLVYRNGSLTSNVFEYPSSGPAGAGSVDTIQGLGVASWRGAGMNFYVVSDGGPDQAGQMSNLFISQGCGER